MGGLTIDQEDKDVHGNNLLHSVCSVQQVDGHAEIDFIAVMKFLLESLDIEARNDSGDTALIICGKMISWGRQDTLDKAKLLLTSGADMETTNKDGESFKSLVA